MMVSMNEVQIVPATVNDVPLILSFTRQIAEYEKLSHEVVATEEGLRESLFGERPAAEVLLAYCHQEPAGYAVFFHNYSTFLGRAGLYLEDLFVKPEYRGRGVGKSLLKRLSRLAVERKCGRFEWCVLDWNEPAIEFYRRLGAQVHPEWRICRVTGDALQRLSET